LTGVVEDIHSPVDKVNEVRFAHQIEREFAEVLDADGIPWLYEPRTFVLERDANGDVTEAITPDFYLPDQDVYVECTVQRVALLRKKRRKIEKLQQRYGVTIALFDRRDFDRFAERHGLAFSTTAPAHASRVSAPESSSARRSGEVDAAIMPSTP
jgi:hypoxanthine phosphoribosyltransferase